MIDIIPGQLFKEEDIVLIQSGPYGKEKDKPKGYAVSISLRGRDKPVIGLYDAESEMQGAVSRIRKAWEESGTGRKPDNSMAEAVRILQERLEETDRRLEEWRALQQEAMAKEAGKKQKAAGTTKKAKKREPKPFVPPTMDDVIKHILENGYEKVAHQKPEGIARRFIRYYAPDGKWRFKDGRPVKDWKKCMANWINRIDEDEETQETEAPPATRPNQFTQGVANNAYDFDTLEKELANSPDAT